MKRRALLVGINSYKNTSNLRGCVNDAANLRSILKECGGFTNDDIRVLLDERATRAAIERRIAWLVADAEPGDLLILHFSGHGSQVRDRGEQDELVDGLDEVLCPHDLDWDDNFITDDALREKLRVPAGATLEVVLDCCHSGSDEAGVMRGPITTGSGGQDRLARFAPPPLDIHFRQEGDDIPTRRRLFRDTDEGQVVLWSACGASQTASDSRMLGVFNGAFSFLLCQQLRATRGRIARNELLERIQAGLQQGGYDQVPELIASPAQAAEVPFALGGQL